MIVLKLTYEESLLLEQGIRLLPETRERKELLTCLKLARNNPEPDPIPTGKWATVEGASRYQIYDCGTLMRGPIRIVAKPYKGRGSMTAAIRMDRDYQTTVTIVQLVGSAFCPDFRRGLYCHYKDGNKQNCAATNLRWLPTKIKSYGE